MAWTPDFWRPSGCSLPEAQTQLKPAITPVKQMSHTHAVLLSQALAITRMQPPLHFGWGCGCCSTSSSPTGTSAVCAMAHLEGPSAATLGGAGKGGSCRVFGLIRVPTRFTEVIGVLLYRVDSRGLILRNTHGFSTSVGSRY